MRRPVARLEEGHVFADRLDHAGQLHPEDRVLRAIEAEDQARHEPLPPRNIEASNPHVPTVRRRRTYLDEHLMILWSRLLCLPEFKSIGRTVSRAHDCLHSVSPSPTGYSNVERDLERLGEPRSPQLGTPVRSCQVFLTFRTVERFRHYVKYSLLLRFRSWTAARLRAQTAVSLRQIRWTGQRPSSTHAASRGAVTTDSCTGSSSATAGPGATAGSDPGDRCDRSSRGNSHVPLVAAGAADRDSFVASSLAS